QAVDSARAALRLAKRCDLPPHLYTAHLLMGQAMEREAKIPHALRHYQRATAGLEDIQRSLTITLRADFMEDKDEAFRGLIRLYLDQGQTELAFDTLERARSHAWLNYLVHREHFRWEAKDERTRSLLDELDLRRAEHQLL